MTKKGANFIIIIELTEYMNKYKRKPKKQVYCKRCGTMLKNQHLQIQLNPKRLIVVCATCFDWARDKTMAEIRKDYRERARRKLKIFGE